MVATTILSSSKKQTEIEKGWWVFVWMADLGQVGWPYHLSDTALLSSIFSGFLFSRKMILKFRCGMKGYPQTDGKFTVWNSDEKSSPPSQSMPVTIRISTSRQIVMTVCKISLIWRIYRPSLDLLQKKGVKILSSEYSNWFHKTDFIAEMLNWKWIGIMAGGGGHNGGSWQSLLLTVTDTWVQSWPRVLLYPCRICTLFRWPCRFLHVLWFFS